MTATEMKPWAELEEPEERDAAVARHVFGMEVMYGINLFDSWRNPLDIDPVPYEERLAGRGNEAWFCREKSMWLYVSAYTRDAQADYSVLEFVRREWGANRLSKVRDLLEKLWASRHWDNEVETNLYHVPAGPLNYVVGDWSWAAYEAKRLAQGEGKR